MNDTPVTCVTWENRTKTIKQLIKELQSFEDQDLVVMVTDNEGNGFHSVKLVSKGFAPNKNNLDNSESVYCALHI